MKRKAPEHAVDGEDNEEEEEEEEGGDMDAKAAAHAAAVAANPADYTERSITDILLCTVHERFGRDLHAACSDPAWALPLNAADVKLCLTWQLIDAVRRMHASGWMHR